MPGTCPPHSQDLRTNPALSHNLQALAQNENVRFLAQKSLILVMHQKSIKPSTELLHAEDQGDRILRTLTKPGGVGNEERG